MDRPILFSGEMVRAILEGRKTQTRRVIKPQPWSIGKDGVLFASRYVLVVDEKSGKTIKRFTDDHGNMLVKPISCPYGQPGDRLWVRETWFADPPYDGTWDQYAFSDGRIENFAVLPERFKTPEFVIYKSTWKGVDLRWRPSIHMPRWASRITLEVVGVRVELVQDITDTGGMREGWKCDPANLDYLPRMWFRDLWESINAKRGYSWASNPWVWAIEFKRVQP